MVFVAAILGIVAAKAIKAAINLVRGPVEKSGQAEESDKKKDTSKAEKEKSREKTVSPTEESAKESESAKEEQTPSFNESYMNQYAAARQQGISEAFWDQGTDVKLKEEALAEDCLNASKLSSLEVSDRLLAGADFFGFNLLVEEDRKMTLTYLGQAVATLTRTEKTVKTSKDGIEASETKVLYRTNTFPPHLSSGMVPGDLEKMLLASDRIIACGGNPESVYKAMVGEFTDGENITKLRQSIDPIIQEKQSQVKDMKKGLSAKPRDLSQNLKL